MRKRSIRKVLWGLFFYLFVSVIVQRAEADPTSWVSVSPTGGIIQQMAIYPQDSNILYVCNDKDGIFKSVDGGKSWVNFKSEKSYYSCAGLTIDPMNSDIVYLQDNWNFYKSIDGGKTWKRDPFQFPLKAEESFRIDQFFLSSKSAQVIYIRGVLFNGQNNSLVIFKSSNGGVNWTRLELNIPSCNFANKTLLEIDSKNPEIVYLHVRDGGDSCSTDKFGIYKSINGGSTWSLIKSVAYLGAPSSRSFLVDKSNSNNLYFYENESSVFRSSDGGVSWTEFKNSENSFDVGKISIDFSGSLYRLVYPAGSVLNGELKLFRSDDQGKSWVELKNEFLKAAHNSPSDYSFGYSEKDKNVVYLIGGKNGVLKSNDKGITWIKANDQLYAYSGIGSNFAANKSHLYAAVSQTFSSYSTYSIKSDDDGKSWESNTEEFGLWSNLYDVVRDPFISNFIISTSKGLFIPDEQQNQWQPTSLTGQIDHVVVDEESAILYAIDDGKTIFTSKNHGKSWEFFATAEKNIFKKEEMGPLAGIVSSPETFRQLKSIKVDRSKNTIYAIFSSYNHLPNIQLSTDNRTSWKAFYQSNDPLNDLDFVPSTAVIYRAEHQKGISQSTDEGKNWVQINNGLTDLEVVSLQFDESTGNLYAGTNSNQIFKMEGVASPIDLAISTGSNSGTEGSSGGCALIKNSSLSSRSMMQEKLSLLFVFIGTSLLFLRRASLKNR